VDSSTKQLKIKNDKLSETLRFERDMFDILGHELRTPLTTVRNAVFLNEKLLNDSTNSINIEKIKQYNDTALRNSQKEIELLNTLLSATKIDNNKLELKTGRVDLVDIVKNSFADFKKKAQDKGLNLILTKPEKAIVFADSSRTHEITDNLIDNAIKYTSDGNIEVIIKPLKNNVVFSVKDSGKGIPKKCIPHLGKKFYRVDNYVDSSSNFNIVRPGGTGLGLYVTFGLAKAMNCRMKVKSIENKGSDFSVYFPK
jgi:signal transduction histidine kinase